MGGADQEADEAAPLAGMLQDAPESATKCFIRAAEEDGRSSTSTSPDRIHWRASHREMIEEEPASVAVEAGRDGGMQGPLLGCASLGGCGRGYASTSGEEQGKNMKSPDLRRTPSSPAQLREEELSSTAGASNSTTASATHERAASLSASTRLSTTLCASPPSVSGSEPSSSCNGSATKILPPTLPADHLLLGEEEHREDGGSHGILVDKRNSCATTTSNRSCAPHTNYCPSSCATTARVNLGLPNSNRNARSASGSSFVRMTDERGPQSKTTEAYRRYLETADFLQEGLYGMPPLAAQESTSDGYWLGTAAPLYSHAQMIGAMGFSEHVLPPPPPPPGKGFHLPAPPGIVPGSAASSLEAILGQSVTHRVAKPPPPPPGLAVAGQPPNPKAPFVPQATARIPPQMYENGPPERTKGSRNEWPRDPAYRPRDAHSIKGKDHPHAGSSSCVVEDVRRAGKPGKNKGAWDPYPLPLWGTGKPAGRHHQKQPTPTEAYDLGMERTMDGGKMDPRKSTPPHLLYNKAHANDKRTPGDLLSPVATSIMSPLIPSPDLAHHQLHASGKAGQQYASQQVVATPVEVPSNGNPTSQQYHAPVLSLSSSAGGEQIKGGAPAPAVDISHCSAEDAGGAAASGGGGCGVTTARGGAYGTAAARGVETGYPTGKGGPASSKGPIKGDVPPITEGYSSASGSNAAARRSTTSSCSNTGGSYSYGASAARSSSGFASASATTTSGFVPGGTTSKMRLNGAPGTSSAHSQKSEGVRPRSSIISGLLPQRWQSWMFGQEEVEDATRGHKSQSIITTTVSAARSGDVDDERNFDGVDDPQHQLLPKATSRTSVLAPFEAASLGQHSREDLNHVSENGGQADLVIKESQQSSSACSSENSCATRVAPEDLPKGVHYATAYTQNRNYSGFQPREEPTVLQDTLRYCPRRLATIENDTKWARDSKVTTVMIRNIPNRYTTEDVLQEIDGRGFYKNYNYFYLPIDFGNKVNMGYAFLNFLAPKHVERFAREFHDTKLPKYATSKILEICAAGKQGLEENVARFLRRDTNRIQNPFFLPLVFGWSSKSEWQAYPLTRENLIKITTRAKEVARELTKKRAAAASTGGQDEMPQAKNDRESKK